jgi:hypothetical protein
MKIDDEWMDLAEEVYAEMYAEAPPEVDVRNDATAADWLREELGQGKPAGVFRRGDMLVHTPRIGEHYYLPPKDLGLVDAGPAQVRPITTIGIKSLIEARYRCWRNTTVQDGDKRTKIKVRAMFPQQAAQSACESARLGEHAPNLKDLAAVTHTPMLRSDGTILSTPGYDTATGFLYLPEPGLDLQWIPDQPRPDQIRAAVDLILTPIEEFPFVSDATGVIRFANGWPTRWSGPAWPAMASKTIPNRCGHTRWLTYRFRVWIWKLDERSEMTAKARILKRRSSQTCTKPAWQKPWPTAVVRHCAQCSAWMVPLWSGVQGRFGLSGRR